MVLLPEIPVTQKKFDVSSKGAPFGPTLWKVRGRGLDLIGRGGRSRAFLLVDGAWGEESKRNRVYVFYYAMGYTHASCVQMSMCSSPSICHLGDIRVIGIPDCLDSAGLDIPRLFFER